MPKYDYAQVASVVNSVFGDLPAGTRTDLVAVVFAESGGNTDAKNTGNKNGTTDWGLFQINDVNWNGEPAAARLDPVVNAKMARRVYDRQGIRAWSAYKNGAYRKFLGQAAPAVASGGGQLGSDSSNVDKAGVPGALNPNPLSGIAGAVGNVQSALDPGSAIKNGLSSIGETLGRLANTYALWLFAVLLVTLGLVVIMRKPVMAVAGPAKIAGAVKGARAAKAVGAARKAEAVAEVGKAVVDQKKAADEREVKDA